MKREDLEIKFLVLLFLLLFLWLEIYKIFFFFGMLSFELFRRRINNFFLKIIKIFHSILSLYIWLFDQNFQKQFEHLNSFQLTTYLALFYRQVLESYQLLSLFLKELEIRLTRWWWKSVFTNMCIFIFIKINIIIQYFNI